MEKPIEQVTLSDLQKAAIREDWEFVDSHLATTINNPRVLEWSVNEGIVDKDGNLRDLAISFLERSPVKLEPETTQKLREMFADENPYVGFRSAFALFTHGDRSSEVIAKIHEAVLDEDVREVAEGYLSQLEE